jgi:hypothetical protein
MKNASCSHTCIGVLLGVLTATTAHAFPIFLQPSKDNTMYEYTGGVDLSSGQGPYLFVGRTNQAIGSIRRGLIAFDLTDIPTGSTINSALLTINLSKTLFGSSTITLHRVLADWGEGASNSPDGAGGPAMPGDATWRHRFYDTTLWSTQGADVNPTVSASTQVSTVGRYTWSSPQLLIDIQGWFVNPATNFGWLMQGDETTSATAKRFDSRNNNFVADRPRLQLDITPLQPLDPFLCYKAKNSPSPLKFQPRTLTLADQLMSETTWQAFKAVSLCNPAQKDGAAVFDEDTHLEGYQLKRLPQTSLPPTHTVQVFNQFHSPQPLVVDTGVLDRLLVPTTKCVDQPPGTCPPQLNLPDPANVVDHYACYKVRANLTAPPFVVIPNVSVADQFITGEKHFTLKKPTHLCLAADKNQEGVKRPLFHLMCYQAKKLAGEPSHVKQKNLHVRNQFDEERLDTVKEEELCVPSSVLFQ